jgi:hypothetical protein
MQTRHQRDFPPHGIDNPIEFHFAHHTLQSAGPTFCRPVRKRARAEHTSSRDFVVRRLGHGHFRGKNGPKSGRSSPRVENPVVPHDLGCRRLAQLAGCVLDSATNQESLHAGRQ